MLNFSLNKFLNFSVNFPFMENQRNWIKTNYNTLVKSYGGKWVIVENNKVVFVAERFNAAFEQYKRLKNKENCEIALIETGDAAFYAIKI